MNPKNTLQIEYIARIDQVLRFIDENLDLDLSLETLAQVANYSAFHFHRVFKQIAGESLNTYILRKRIEKMAGVLMYRPEISVTELSLQYGFNSNSSFTRAFKKYYGVSPTQFRQQMPSRFSKIRQIESKNRQVDQVFEEYICNINDLKNWIKMNAKIEIKKFAPLKLACVSTIGVQGISNAYQELLKWAVPKNLLGKESTKIITIYHDSFKITAPEKVRMSACISVGEEEKVEGKVHLTTLQPGKCIVGYFEISLADFEKSWSSLFVWMNEKGYQKAEGNPFEIYHNDFREDPNQIAKVDFCIPIR
ncbi:AraC family transcriptional regulator [Pedobacter chitinilyticus]|uniref:AraC family transcriptional regulator n=1 Tax=Pedobacter chitinilyticus TaxID=2233776 RepID=A0A443Z1M3_9SPHI|nr:AraC family transcriptional regulator [Pedobacter chitinilyticus]RWU10438.1 AraC family transcriptional regulator [Pedobacter chitinilyticus]